MEMPGATILSSRLTRVIRSEQLTRSERLAYLLRSSRVISNLPIFTPPGDTTNHLMDPETPWRQAALGL